jgi:hypothetical protein
MGAAAVVCYKPKP